MTQPPSPHEPNPWAPPQRDAQEPAAPGQSEQFGQPGQPGQQTMIDGPPAAPYAPGQGYGYGPTPPYGYGPQPEAPRNGMGIAALVLGIFGLLLSFTVFLFWLSWLPCLLAVIFGFVALGHIKKGVANNQGLAWSGLALGAVGMVLTILGGVLTVTLFKTGVDEYDRILQVEASESRKADDAQSRKAADEAAAEKARHLKFGETYTYPNGLKVTVAKPLPYAFDDYTVSVETKGKKALQVVVTVVNGSSAPVDFKTALPQATDAEGNDAELVIDASSRQQIISGKVGPGKTKVGKTAYAMPAGATGSLEVIFTPDVAHFEDLTWSGPTK
ncbi:DUF4190 domain-containing protein [Streptomyces sp. NPDC048442]|uniref:DUF4190 domain-containing protein n=1 Tax=Streptomyces sp. NPDC048442 TaxID=3154823 RepID=UPI00343238E0